MKLYEKYLIDSTFTQGYADDKMAQDDDYPTGNILMGDKYKKTSYYNRLTKFNTNWEPETNKWIWSDFEACGGMGSKDSYNDTLKKNNTEISTDRLFYHMSDNPPQSIPKNLRALGNDVLPDTDAFGRKISAAETDQNKVVAESILRKLNYFLGE